MIVVTVDNLALLLGFNGQDREVMMFAVIVKFVDFVGAIPVVVGAPNIQDFAPLPGSVLHIKEVKHVDPVAKTMKYLADNPDAYNQSLR